MFSGGQCSIRWIHGNENQKFPSVQTQPAMTSHMIILEMEEGNLKEADSLSSQNEANTVVKHSYSALDVAHGFVKQYYKIMQSFPTETHNFYKEQSILSHPCADGSMKSVTTLKGIDDEIMASNIKEWNPNLNTVHAQDSIIGSMVVGILGSLIDNTDVSRNCAQTFVLASQEGGGFYFIQSNKTSEALPSLDDVANPLTAQQANDTQMKDSLFELKTAQTDSYLAKKGSGSSTTSPLTNPGVKGLAKMEKKSVTSAALNTAGSPDRSSTIPNSGPLENIYDGKMDRILQLTEGRNTLDKHPKH
ncbi:hypothetical protein R6Q57_015156 [Mikania cordata]